jgi:hypothetical protein
VPARPRQTRCGGPDRSTWPVLDERSFPGTSSGSGQPMRTRDLPEQRAQVRGYGQYALLRGFGPDLLTGRCAGLGGLVRAVVADDLDAVQPVHEAGYDDLAGVGADAGRRQARGHQGYSEGQRGAAADQGAEVGVDGTEVAHVGHSWLVKQCCGDAQHGEVDQSRDAEAGCCSPVCCRSGGSGVPGGLPPGSGSTPAPSAGRPRAGMTVAPMIPMARDKHAIADQLCYPQGLHGDCIRSSSSGASQGS